MGLRSLAKRRELKKKVERTQWPRAGRHRHRIGPDRQIAPEVHGTPKPGSIVHREAARAALGVATEP